jgi:nucleotide-binding universal stress UspA family protein
VTRVDLALFPNRDNLMPEQMPIDSVEIGEIENQRIGDARELAERSAGRLQDVGFRVDTKVTVGHPSQEILDHADKGDYDLVVLGSRGLGGVARTLL